MNRNEGQKPILAAGIGSRRNLWTWPVAGAFLGLAGSSVAGAIGAIFAVVAMFTNNAWQHSAGTILLVMMIPLLMSGAHCLDVVDQQLHSAPEPEEEKGVVKNRNEMKFTIVNHTYARRGAGFLAAVVTGFLLFGTSSTAYGQQTIFNVPTTDVLERGKVYFELDVSFKFNSDPNNSVNRFSSAVPRIVVGTGGRVEIGLNVTGNIQPGADSTTLVPTLKWKAYDGGRNGWAVVTGDHLFVPVRNKSYNVGNYVYLEASKTFNGKTRVTFGGYHFSDNVVAPNAQRAGGQFGFEQTVNSKFSIIADWYTGKHAAGYFTPGIAFKPHPKVTGYFGYSIGNTGASRGNHFFLAEIGINFN